MEVERDKGRERGGGGERSRWREMEVERDGKRYGGGER